MRTERFFLDLVAEQKRGTPRGICSVCSAHSGVLEAAFIQAERDGQPVLVESTVNQVNQFGGYTGMTPESFAGYVGGIADAMRFPRERIIIGGDHLGPYPWRAESAESAMAKSRGLVSASVLAGYAKIHLDASMPLGGDATDDNGGVDPRLIAEREAELAAAAEAAYRERLRAHPQASPPVYVIGTEVPPPGGIVADGGEGQVSVTRAEDLRQTVSQCGEAFAGRGLADAWTRVCAVVAQPGVEYGDQDVIAYDRSRAAALCAAARDLPGMILEGHSTDYQSTERLRQLVEDGVAILKVGPALTFALRECLFGLECIERELLRGRPTARPSALSETLERAMLADPAHWRSYYRGDEPQQALARRFSLSDRSRYYWTVPAVSASVGALLANLESAGIPLTLLSQFLPVQHAAVRDGLLRNEPVALLRESVRRVLERYSIAARDAH
jgi:D-tagatose-1,6-bisphosphate aldolase subunit GatZ/KbaZ